MLTPTEQADLMRRAVDVILATDPAHFDMRAWVSGTMQVEEGVPQFGCGTTLCLGGTMVALLPGVVKLAGDSVFARALYKGEYIDVMDMLEHVIGVSAGIRYHDNIFSPSSSFWLNLVRGELSLESSSLLIPLGSELNRAIRKHLREGVELWINTHLPSESKEG